MALWAAPVVGVALVVPFADAAEADAVKDPVPTTVTVGERERDGERSVSVAFSLVEAPQPYLATSGLVTAVLYEHGKALKEGARIVEVDGVTLRAHRGERPFHRELGAGASGRDVTELVRFLKATGHKNAAVDTRGRVGIALVTAIKDYQRSIRAQVDGVFRPSYVIHLDAGTTALDRPEVVVGRPVNAGDPVGEGRGQASAARFTTGDGRPVTMPVAGPYVLTGGDGLEEPVTGFAFEGADAEKLRTRLVAAGLTATPPNDMTPDEVFFDLTLAAAKPVTVGSVATSALHGAPGGGYCLFRLAEGADPATATPVKIDDATPLDGEVALAAVDRAHVGEQVVRAASRLPASVLAGCV
ncbi:peptidoglycan-binding protein [Sanguibacter sp. HDW7]|uniref:peptidoglycan-binding domain-containing protein n=1 Tax=Sanguibacter sp. HDW7 TaxID=2714931 RepID=UPI001408159D|nr:hypothetical protein [Sanguibacter sp. HDW7]QIK84521.1 hypothetical protein G7063_13545 [Sanguibacter sp. HDW7]